MYICTVLIIVFAAYNFTLTLQRPPLVTGLSPLALAVNGSLPSVLYAAGWLWMGWKNGRGRAWARILSSVFFALFCGVIAYEWVKFPDSLAHLKSPAIYPPTLLVWVIALAAIILIWHPRSAPFYRRRPPKTVPGVEPAQNESGT
jgi:hypothetical protein